MVDDSKTGKVIADQGAISLPVFLNRFAAKPKQILKPKETAYSRSLLPSHSIHAVNYRMMHSQSLTRKPTYRLKGRY